MAVPITGEYMELIRNLCATSDRNASIGAIGRGVVRMDTQQRSRAQALLDEYDSAYKAHKRFRNRLICLAILCLGAAGLLYRWIR